MADVPTPRINTQLETTYTYIEAISQAIEEIITDLGGNVEE